MASTFAYSLPAERGFPTPRLTPVDLREREWDASYRRGDNLMLYPKEEAVKFLNRFVRKRTGLDTFRNILSPHEPDAPLRGLDFGCGIGRLSVLLEEFGIEAHGVDISATALETGRRLAAAAGFPGLSERLRKIEGSVLPYDADYFDIGISAGVLDSMPYEAALASVRELDRVVRRYLYVDLISGDDFRRAPGFCGEELVRTAVEFGTVQSYFTAEKIRDLFAGTRFAVRFCRRLTEQSLLDDFRYSRYHVVLERT